MTRSSPFLLLALLATISFSLATSLELRVGTWTDPTRTGGAFTKLLGDGRRLFANHFVEMADVYLHSGFYPSIFDRRDAKAPKAIAGGSEGEHDDHDHGKHQHDENGKCIHEDEHEKAMAFLDEPRNWLDAFIRRFRITEHTHLENGQEREVLPWLKIAIELDPQKVETYTSTAYWLRKQLGRVKDAEDVLREGIRNNPGSPELLFEMGLLHKEGYQDLARARNLWSLALRRWAAQPDEVQQNTTDMLGKIAVHFGRLEESAGNLQLAIQHYEIAGQVSPSPQVLQAHVAELRTRLRPATPSTTPLKPVP